MSRPFSTKTFSTMNGSVESLYPSGFRAAVMLAGVFGPRRSAATVTSGFEISLGGCERTRPPLGTAIGGLGLQGMVDHLGHLLFLVSARPAGAKLVVQAFQAQLPIAFAPRANGHARQLHALTDDRIAFTGPAARSIGGVTWSWPEPGAVEPCRR